MWIFWTVWVCVMAYLVVLQVRNYRRTNKILAEAQVHLDEAKATLDQLVKDVSPGGQYYEVTKEAERILADQED